MASGEHADLFMHPAYEAAAGGASDAPEASDSRPEQPEQAPAAAACGETAEATSVGSAGQPEQEDPAASSGGNAGADADALTPEQHQQLLRECEQLKQQGNELYAAGDYDAALQLYWQAIDTAPEVAQERAVYYCNAAACYLKQAAWQLAVEQCTAALKLNDSYLKALVRRATALQELDDLEHALTDAQRVLELDPGNAWAARAVAELGPRVTERQEKMKEEMLGKLKDLGNSLLGKFGLSLDNFKAEQDPATGGYSIKFSQ